MTLVCPRRILTALLVCAIAGATPDVSAQQFVTDDATVVDRNACQVEAWYAAPASWVLPACQLVRNLEMTAGIGRVEAAEAGHELRYVLQGKSVLYERGPNGFGIGAVAGIGLDPLGQIIARRLDGVYALVPVSIPILGDHVVLHQNVGWAWASAPDDAPDVGVARRRHALTWGMRMDVGILGRVVAIAELFGQSRAFPEYQAGVRLALRRDRLLADVSYSGATAGDARGAFTAGIAWTPASWW